MTKKHEVNDVVVKVEDSFFFDFFSDSIKIINSLSPLYSTLSEFIDDPDGNVTDEDVFDELDDTNLSISKVCEFSECFTSVVVARSKYLQRTGDTLLQLDKNIRNITKYGRYPQLHEAEILRDQIFSVIGGLSYFLIYDFCIDEIIECKINKMPEPAIDDVYSAYTKAHGLDPFKFGHQLLLIQKTFKLRLDLFDEFPEYERPFEDIMGPDYNLVPEGILSLEDVKEVIDGVISPQELLERLNCSSEDE